MKLSQYARVVGVTYRTAFRWWQNGQIKGYQLPSGTIVVTEGEKQAESRPEELVAIYTRVSDHAHRANLERQAQRLEDYCAAKGYRVYRVVKEIGSGVNDNRAKFLALLEDQRITRIIVEHKDRATRFGFRYVEVLLRGQGRTLEVVNLADNDREDLLHDLVAVIYSLAARLYGQRRAKRKTEAIVAQLKQEGLDATGRATSDSQD
jgi:predicted site-specific integrase-resolvase